MELKDIGVGMYVRTNKVPSSKGGYKPNEISKIISIYDYDNKIKLENDTVVYADEILKVSKNITNLIEDKDYVNGYKVIVMNNIKHILTEKGLEFMGIYWNNQTIKSVVTHEQFSYIEYKTVNE